ncbi:hypothetical protein A6B38_04845 [Bartonella bacilliformis]|uniref:Flagellar assembly protein FliH/Type III secretion system HrpE domain-containing protein n=2 Tax=Bartonella bacilliformis TaxID=774 RepID=A1UTT6_BARBK|nr:hypothetical protein BARBAKC583_1128 [Bartonella bacilliformis KC583]AMG86133.1 hypothetical protein AL467_05325 [Bartonella bacilliformis]KZM37487.1 hypothetical protein AWH67_04930 [Bartonella bacilliformis]KZN21525.1 hypothetical protein A6B38_04845 [Bartonella bacilliformis]QFZ90699.1 hypothetical protein GHC17_04965 [Bartonella bacilliformis]
MNVVNRMEKISEEFQRKASLPFSSVLRDFSRRHVVDEEEEILSFVEQAGRMCEDEGHEAFSLSGVVLSEENMEDILPLHVNAEKTIDVHALQQEVVHQAVQETTEKLQMHFSAEKKRMEEEHVKALEIAKDSAIEALGADMHRQLTEGLANLRQEIAQDIAQILSGFIGERMTQDVLKQFAAKLAGQVVDANQSLILEGNEKLFEQLKKQQEFNSSQFEFHPTNSTEIRLRRGEVVVATQLAPLLASLQELIQ